jgi:predicted hydrocarbon binding protein
MVSMNIDAGANGLSHLWLGLEDVLGPAEVKRLQTTGAGQVQLSVLRSRMDSLYGRTGAHGLAICSGRAAFKYLLETQGQEMGFEEASYRFLPIRVKVRRGLELLANWIGKTYGMQVTVVSGDKEIHFKVEGSKEGESPALCDFTVGLLQGFLAWVSGGKFYMVKETECRTLGAGCCDFQVGKNPLE